MRDESKSSQVAHSRRMSEPAGTLVRIALTSASASLGPRIAIICIADVSQTRGSRFSVSLAVIGRFPIRKKKKTKKNVLARTSIRFIPDINSFSRSIGSVTLISG